VKLTTVLTFGAGYVLGTKAGRERYAQIIAAADRAAKRLEAYGERHRPDAGAASRGGSGQRRPPR
jgi:hypothetical protein